MGCASWAGSRVKTVTIERRRGLFLDEPAPAIYPFKESLDHGGLMSYGNSQATLHRHAVHYVDKILQAARPADRPSSNSRPWNSVNVKAAQALGLRLAPDIAAQLIP
jgi:putative ABC transport system substrate-binding protein